MKKSNVIMLAVGLLLFWACMGVALAAQQIEANTTTSKALDTTNAAIQANREQTQALIEANKTTQKSLDLALEQQKTIAENQTFLQRQLTVANMERWSSTAIAGIVGVLLGGCALVVVAVVILARTMLKQAAQNGGL